MKLKSTENSLMSRGFANEQECEKYRTLTVGQLYSLLSSGLAVERTCAVRVLHTKADVNDEHYIKNLLEQLASETALYTKIAICDSLATGGENAALQMCRYLGKIGSNQHKTPGESSKKKSYPLARDIIARTLGRMDKSVFAVLLKELNTDDVSGLSELIDAIGYMAFYNEELAVAGNFKEVQKIFYRFPDNELIVWKIATCCSAFKLKESVELLRQIKANYNRKAIIAETERSLSLIDCN